MSTNCCRQQAAHHHKPISSGSNLAASLTDGQEVYVLAVGKSPPTYQGGVP